MDLKNKLQQLRVMLNQATKEAILQENVLQGVRQRAAEIQGRINQIQELLNEENVNKKKRSKA